MKSNKKMERERARRLENLRKSKPSRKNSDADQGNDRKAVQHVAK